MNISIDKSTLSHDQPSLVRQQNATRAAFLIAGVAVSAWAPLVPVLKDRLTLDEAGLGILLLALGAGSLAGMPLAGGLTARLGCRATIVGAAMLACSLLPVLAYTVSVPVAAIALLGFGAGIGAIDCAMNIHAVIVERNSERRMMSGFHGLYSAGGIAGAGGMTLAFSLGLSPVFAALLVCAALLAATGLASTGLLRGAAGDGGAAFAWPRGIVAFIGLLCFVGFLAEGAVLDWSGVLLQSIEGAGQAWAGMGYAAFSATMTLGRLSGDCFVARFGGTVALLFGALLASGGLAFAALAGSAVGAVAGFALVGLGCANIVPVLFSAAARQRAMPEHAAIAAVTTIGYAGVLTGPAAIGFVAQGTSLVAALLCVSGLLLAIAASARLLKH